MSVSVSMPQLGESVTEGTVTRWLKREGDHVSADEPLLEVSTDKVDTEIPSPVSGILRGITVAEDETVAVGAELAVIDEDGSGGYQQAEYQAPAAQEQPQGYQPQDQAPAYQAQDYQAQGHQEQPYQPQESYGEQRPAPQQPAAESAGSQPATGYEAPPSYADQGQPPAYPPYSEQPSSYRVPSPAEPAPYQPAHAETAPPAGYQPPAYQPGHAEQEAPAQQPAAPSAPAGADGSESPYVTPLVRKLAAEHDVDLGSVMGTGVGGRIRKQDVLDAARQRHGGEAPRPAPGAAPAQQPPAQQPPAQQPQAAAAPGSTAPAAPAAAAGQPAADVQPKAATIPAPSTLRGTTERLSRARQVIAQRMVESLQTSAQLTTVVEADVTAIARLRGRIKTAFEAREGVKLSFLPFFALATVEALKAHPRLNAVIDISSGTVTYHDAEHLGIAVDTERGLMVPVIRNAGDLNIGGLARKIADLAQRTRAGQVSPDDLTGGTFTLTNTGSRGALFDTPIINQPQVGILGTGTVNKRAVVVDDPDLGEVITVRSIVYLALTYDHRLVDGADAARFLVTIKNRLEEGAFEAEFGR
ncbi:MAG TPA: 2-oxo acid dehydrogenase subunit E2 [Streptosporangiaceae bacterium]|nr:2-oxo acid dehydrogenase subunit E2 [Streptosporangiaceae bacterium]